MTLTSATRQPGSSAPGPRQVAALRGRRRAFQPDTLHQTRAFVRVFVFVFVFVTRFVTGGSPSGRPARRARAGTMAGGAGHWATSPSMTSLWCAKMTILGRRRRLLRLRRVVVGGGARLRSAVLHEEHLLEPLDRAGQLHERGSRWRDTDFLVVPRDAPRRLSPTRVRRRSRRSSSPVVSLVSLVSLASPSPSPSPRRWAPCRAVSMEDPPQPGVGPPGLRLQTPNHHLLREQRWRGAPAACSPPSGRTRGRV